ncbi:Na+/H+ antiporter NhaA [Aestuariimicrobium ganziense]|uniref:Na+/H+ antiporter NhaA n=1 Tax=Aestuariimicrobium ganziense TaxID=2773677 RepID=UPI002E2CAA04|nr:Na+/H+ antiporter NhaA [Aestuariimicrobium ganziense]
MTSRRPFTLRRILFRPAQGADALHLPEVLRRETTGGFLMLFATVVALVWANAEPMAYQRLAHHQLGPLSLAHWATDGLLTVFFFSAGMELKRELTEGSLSRPADALVPIVAAVCGMVVPAGIYLATNLLVDGGSPRGWAIPMATDIAFALAVLAIVGNRLPAALRAFLLTLAIVDDLGAILVIAIGFSHGINLVMLAGAAACMALWWLMQRRRIDNGWFYVPLFVLTWYLMLQSGVHATIAGVGLGLLTRATAETLDEPLDRWQHNVQPWSAGLVVPLFALFAAGVAIDGDALRALWTDPVPLGVILGLVAGKIIGVYLGARLTARFTSAELGEGVEWGDLLAVAQLAGIGFTVSLLISELAFAGTPELAPAKMAVLTASVIAAITGSISLMIRGRRHAPAAAVAVERP